MVADLLNDLNGQLAIGLGQTAGAIALCLAIVALCRRFAVHVEREAVISIGRGLVQMVVVGVVLALLLHSDLPIGALILMLMTVAAAVTASRHLKGIAAPVRLSFWAILTGSAVVIAAMLATGILKGQIATLVPVGSMIIANAMNACAQAAERFIADVAAHVGQIEAALTLGAEPDATVARYVQRAVHASLLPRLDMLRSLGLVWIPGMMAGMMTSGASPLYAGIYQFVVVAMILAASGLTGMVAILLMRRRVFSSAAQLILRGEGLAKTAASAPVSLTHPSYQSAEADRGLNKRVRTVATIGGDRFGKPMVRF